jgi:hypothetical protein
MDDDILKEFEEMFNFDVSKKQLILNKIITDDIIKGEKIDISDDVYKDTCVDKWISKLPILDGSQILIEKLMNISMNLIMQIYMIINLIYIQN